MDFQLLLLAAEGHHAPPLIDIDGTVFIQGGIFLVMLFFLNTFVFRPYLQLRKEQAINTAGARERAEQESVQADEQLESYEQQVMQAKKEAAAKRAELRAEGESKAQQTLGLARKEADKKLEKARAELAKSAPAARLALRTRADELAQVVASRVLGREIR
jgi:F-type H+-transporting ATPase subunit b